MQFESFKKRWEILEADKTEYTIMLTTASVRGYGSWYSPEEHTIYLNPVKPEAGMKGDGLLNHELGHMYEHYLYNFGGGSASHQYYLESLKVSGSDRTRLIEKCERIILGKYEAEYNKLRGYDVRTWYYTGDSRIYLDGDVGDTVIDWHILEDYNVGKDK